jgi:predicted TIM-barrel fold metal-dependent hydrolase
MVKRIDAHTHFTPVKFLSFMEKAEGRPFALTPNLISRPPLIDVKPRIELLDRYEIDMHVLVPIPWIDGFPKVYNDPALAAEAARLMNDELAAVVATYPTRFRGVAILPTVNPDVMLAELNRTIKELGFIGAYLAVGPTAKRLDHPDFEHLYKALVDLDVTLWLHPSRPPTIPDYVDEKLSQYYDWQLIGWPHDSTSAMFRVVFAGVYDRYPSLRIVIHHHGAFVPLLAGRLINVWPGIESVGLPMPTKVKKPYVDHFRNFYCDTACSGFVPKALELAVDFFGPERVLFGSDVPFDVEDGRIFTVETLRSIDAMAVSAETRTSILSGNAERIFKLK